MNLLIIAGGDSTGAALGAQRQRRPAPALRLGGQLLVGVDRHRAADLLEQRQVVVRVAVEDALGEAREALAAAGEPFVEAAHLALAEAGRAGDAAGEAPAARLGLGGDQ